MVKIRWEKIFFYETRKEPSSGHIYNRSENGHEDVPDGILAEDMVFSLLRKMSIDMDSCPFSIEPSDPHEDVEEKIDFTIHRLDEKAKQSGLVRSTNRVKDVAVQFTTARSVRVIDHKTKQIEVASRKLNKDPDPSVEEIVLVTLSELRSRGVYNEWKKRGNQPMPGGPDVLWDEDTKEVILKGILRRLFKPRDLDRLWKGHAKPLLGS